MLNVARPLILALKSTMDQYDLEGNEQAIKALIEHQATITVSRNFEVADHDVSLDPDCNSNHCFWIIPAGQSVDSLDEDVEIIISPQTEPLLFTQLLSYALTEIIKSFHAEQGARIAFYIDISYAMLILFEDSSLVS